MSSLAAILIVLAVSTPLVAFAQSEDADALIEQGLALRREHRDEEALALFRRAHEMHASPRALAQIALAEQATGLWVDAHAHLSEALEAEDDPWIAPRRDALRGSLASIEERLGRLEISGRADGAQVRIDGVERATLPLATPLWVPAGRIVVEVRAEGHHPFSRTLEVSPGGLARMQLQLVELGAGQGSDAPRSGDAGASTDGFAIAGGVSLALAAVSLGVGIGFHAARESDAQYFAGDDCELAGMTRGEACPATLSAIRSSEIGMGIGYVGAGLFAITGAILVAVGAMQPPGTATALSCGGGPTELSAACSARF